MRLCSVTVSSNKESIIRNALLSVVDWVDCVLIIDLYDCAIPRDKTLEIAKEIAKDKLHIVTMNIEADTSIAGMRNFALKAAYDIGMDWACMVDTDERMMLNGVNVKQTLEKIPSNIDTLLTRDNHNEYEKHRFFRLPTTYQFNAFAHEEWSDKDKYTILTHIQFWELPKSPEELEKRLINSDLPNLIKQMENDPTNYRWPYYMGTTLETLKRYEEAIGYYNKALRLVQHHPLRAWFYVRIALCYYRLQQWQEALLACTVGMTEDPSYSELPWIAGMICYAIGRMDNALQWEKIALVNSWIGKKYHETNRVGLKELQAFFEGPYHVMAEVYKSINEPGLEAWARKKERKALEDREDFKKR